VAALHPERARGLVSVNGYNIQNIAASATPGLPENEYRHWYQYYFHGERGRAGLAASRFEFCQLLWRLWSPTWKFDSDTYSRSAAAFDNPDFVDVVIHSYRHRFGLVAGDARFDEMERRLSAMPAITVPTVTLVGTADGVMSVGDLKPKPGRFTGQHENRVIDDVGHNLPQEAPDAFARAVLDVQSWAG
jgi:pimeloyl-ACP methyl ester carboxylesterase